MKQSANRTLEDNAKSVVITGASSGFGEGAVKSFADKGYRVWGTMRDAEGRNAGKKTALEAYSARVSVIDMDVTEDGSVAAGFARILNDGPVDVLINNAGIMFLGITEAFSVAQAHEQMNANYYGAIRTMQAVLPAMRKAGTGLIINCSSLVGRISPPFFGTYAATKHALEGYSQCLRYEVAPFGVDIAIVEPGPFGTGLLASGRPPALGDVLASYGELAGVPAAMKLTQVILFVLTPVAIFMLLACTAKATASIPVIYETDITLDCDDVGALAVLHGLQNEGKVNILAVCYNEVHPSGAAAIDAINTWYGRGDIPVGVYKGRLSNPDRSRYLEALTHFPHDLDNERAASALDTYRQVLADQPDRSVTIISVGFLNNLYDLLKDPGSYALVEKKVKLLVAMGGLNNDGFNFSRHGLVDQTQYVIENWPGTLVTTHVGGSMITGQTLTATTPVNNPVRRAYELHRGPNTGRSSWDQVSVLYAAYGTQWFNETWAGGGSLRNGYTWKFKNGYRGYAAPKDDSQVKDEIERLMTLAPQGTRPRVIVMTDGEVDDRSSMIRFLLYTCDVDVRAIIETNSMFQRHGHSDDPWYENQLGATLESEVIRDAAVGGETIYVATDDHGLAIVDASNNEDLRAVGYYREGESVQAVSVQGRQAYISYADRIEMLDISDGQRVKLQRSANLVDWEDWQTMTLGGNATGCGLIDATTATPQRFYRAVEGMPRPTDEP